MADDLPAYMQAPLVRAERARIDGFAPLADVRMGVLLGNADDTLRQQLALNIRALQQHQQAMENAIHTARYAEDHVPPFLHNGLNQAPVDGNEIYEQTVQLYGRAVERGKVRVEIPPETGFTDHLDKDGKSRFGVNYLAHIGGAPLTLHNERQLLARYLRGDAESLDGDVAPPFKLPGPDNAQGVPPSAYELPDDESVETIVGMDDFSTLMPDPGSGVKLASDQNRIPYCAVWRTVIVRTASASNIKYRQLRQASLPANTNLNTV